MTGRDETTAEVEELRRLLAEIYELEESGDYADLILDLTAPYAVDQIARRFEETG